MATRRLLLVGALLAGALHVLPAVATAPKATLSAYGSEAELIAALTRWRDAAAKVHGERRRVASEALAMQAAPSAPPAAIADLAKSLDASGRADAESITNVQTQGVDEGGIVKRAGDHLVILRRGRLFTVRVGADTLQPAAMIDAYAPGSNPSGAWYDELLISGSTIVVVGYSYTRGGTEIGLFELSRDGTLAYRATYHLRSFDYYSSRNYASRLIGTKLVFYSPTILSPHAPRPWEMMPGMRRYHGEAAPREWERILPATRIYRTDDDFDARETLALHTVTACELKLPMHCESSAVLGPAGRVFYVSQGSVYVWTSTSRRRPLPLDAAPEGRALSAVVRIPLDASAPSALATVGVPIDQMSFLEDASGHLNVLLREAGAGEGMFGSERTHGRVALLRVPLAAFGDGRGAAQREHYRSLPAASGYAVQNRYVGDWLLWGGMPSGRASAWALRYAGGSEPQALAPGHAVERIEAMGGDALLVGNAGSELQFTSVRLARDDAAIAGRHVQTGARQGETRTHGFFFRPTGSDEALLGLPVLEQGSSGRYGVYAGAQGSASVLFLRQRDLAFTALGRLEARPEQARDDACKASCVDWYGNARPIFLGERVFALLGYELVEGRLAGGRFQERIDERRRISFAPRTAAERLGRYTPFE